MTGASVNFKAVKSAGHAVSHASREVAPTYLLPSDKSMGTVVLLDDKGKVSQVLDAKMALASPRAKVDQRYSPVWEGILNLRRPEPGEDAKQYRDECSAVVTDWYKRYEASTGHKVLRVDVHLDEGHMVDGEAVLNAHAHVIADRTNDLGRVIKLSPKQLRELQTMTSKVTNLERGKSSFETGRKHISHQAYKHLAEQGRLEKQQIKVKLDKSQSDLTRQRKLSKEWSDADLAKVKNLQAKLDGEPARLAAALAAQEEKYRLDREALKASGTAKQADYQALKTQLKTAQAEASKVPALETQVIQQTAAFESLKVEAMAVITPLRTEVKTMKTKITQLEADNAKLEADKARFAEMANTYQEEKAKGTPAHLIQPAPEATKTAQEPPEQPDQGNSIQPPAKSLKERLNASWEAMVGWIKGAGGKVVEIDEQRSEHHGPVFQLDDWHAVQSTGRGLFAIHQLDHLDNVPARDDPKMIIRYKGGVGQVKGQSFEKGGIGD
jgi:hypothetical protein